jgi:hypothetical protein
VTPRASGVDPAGRVTLSADVASAAPQASLVLLWSVVSLPQLDLRDASKVGTPLNTATLGLLPGALLPGVRYTFTLSARDANGVAAASADVSVMAVPAGGGLSVSAATGTALETTFTLTTGGWTDDNEDADGDGAGDGYPLQYAFSYTVGVSVRAASQRACHMRAGSSRTPHTGRCAGAAGGL